MQETSFIFSRGFLCKNAARQLHFGKEFPKGDFHLVVGAPLRNILASTADGKAPASQRDGEIIIPEPGNFHPDHHDLFRFIDIGRRAPDVGPSERSTGAVYPRSEGPN